MYMTNAAHNRKQACRLFEAGYTPAEIAAEFPLAYRCNAEGKLSLVYCEQATRALHQRDYTARQHGLEESNLMVSTVAVAKLIKRKSRVAASV